MRVNTLQLKHNVHGVHDPRKKIKRKGFEEYNEKDNNRRACLNYKIRKARKKLKANLSLDAGYFHERSRISELEVERAMLHHKRSQTEFFKDKGQNPEDADLSAWNNSDEAKSLHEKKSALELNAKIFKAQAEARTVQEGNDDQLYLRHYMQLYTTSTKGLTISAQTAGMGQRDTKIQSAFRDMLKNACNSCDPDPKKGTQLWCPVLSVWVTEVATKAAHVFPFEMGQIAMDTIFGTFNPPELNRIENGWILSYAAEERIARGDIVIVPNVPDDFSKSVMDQWSASAPKSYKIRILNPTAKGMDMYHPNGIERGITWIDLDGKELHFRSDHRPRTRYLYWQYCQSMLRIS